MPELTFQCNKCNGRYDRYFSKFPNLQDVINCDICSQKIIIGKTRVIKGPTGVHYEKGSGGFYSRDYEKIKKDKINT